MIRMRKIILFILLSLSFNTYSQELSPRDSVKVEKLENEMKELRREGYTTMGVGIFVHLISIVQLTQGLKDPMNLSPFGIYTGIALGFDGLSFYKFRRSRQIKKEIKLIKETTL